MPSSTLPSRRHEAPPPQVPSCHCLVGKDPPCPHPEGPFEGGRGLGPHALRLAGQGL